MLWGTLTPKWTFHKSSWSLESSHSLGRKASHLSICCTKKACRGKKGSHLWLCNQQSKCFLFKADLQIQISLGHGETTASIQSKGFFWQQAGRIQASKRKKKNRDVAAFHKKLSWSSMVRISSASWEAGRYSNCHWLCVPTDCFPAVEGCTGKVLCNQLGHPSHVTAERFPSSTLKLVIDRFPFRFSHQRFERQRESLTLWHC